MKVEKCEKIKQCSICKQKITKISLFFEKNSVFLKKLENFEISLCLDCANNLYENLGKLLIPKDIKPLYKILNHKEIFDENEK